MKETSAKKQSVDKENFTVQENMISVPLKPGHTFGTIPQDQLSLPIGFRNGDMISLHDFMDYPDKVTMLETLTKEQIVDLCINRIQQRSDFEIGVVGIGNITKDRAIQEVKSSSPIGESLIQIELRVINRLKEMIMKQNK